MRKLVYFLLCLTVLIGTAGCEADETEKEAVSPAVNVVTTIYPLADITEQLGGERVNVSYLLPAGASPHTYEPTVEQAKLVEKADFFVHIGAGLDDWAVKLAAAAETELALIDLSGEIDLIEPVDYQILEGPDSKGHPSDDHSTCDHDHGSCDHDHGPVDPHYWLDPLIVRDSICPAIYVQLLAVDPGREDFYDQKYDQYRLELTALHEEIEETVSDFSRRGFIAFHSAWQYFGQRYGLEEVAVIADFPGQEPSAGWVAELVELIKDEDMGAIFAEPQFPTALADRIAEESGSEVRVLDPLGGEGVPGRESYLDIMRFNLDSFREAME